MRLASIKPDGLALVLDGSLIPIGERLVQERALAKGASMIDLIAAGNPDVPAFQKQLGPGDTLRAEIEGIGAMNLRVTKEN